MPELHRGTVTFLFTDIEGSTRLLQRLGGEYAEVLSEQQRILRAAFAAHGGYEVDSQGDSFFVSFQTAKDAVAAAVDGQRDLAAQAWPEGVRGPGADGVAHRGAAGRRRALCGDRGASGGPDRGGRPRRAGVVVVDDPGAGRGGPAARGRRSVISVSGG